MVTKNFTNHPVRSRTGRWCAFGGGGMSIIGGGKVNPAATAQTTEHTHHYSRACKAATWRISNNSPCGLEKFILLPGVTTDLLRRLLINGFLDNSAGLGGSIHTDGGNIELGQRASKLIKEGIKIRRENVGYFLKMRGYLINTILVGSKNLCNKALCLGCQFPS